MDVGDSELSDLYPTQCLHHILIDLHKCVMLGCLFLGSHRLVHIDQIQVLHHASLEYVLKNNGSANIIDSPFPLKTNGKLHNRHRAIRETRRNLQP